MFGNREVIQEKFVDKWIGNDYSMKVAKLVYPQ